MNDDDDASGYDLMPELTAPVTNYDGDGLDIPLFLLRAPDNTRLFPDMWTPTPQLMPDMPVHAAEPDIQAGLREQQQEIKRQEARKRIAKMLEKKKVTAEKDAARAAGATKEMPLSGKDALAKIRGE